MGRAHLASSSPLEPFWARVASMLFAGICAAIAFARIPAGDWLLTPWMGGSGGVMMLDGVVNVLHPVIPGPVHAVVAVVAGIIACAALLHACAVNRDELTGFTGLVWRGVSWACAFATDRVVALFAWIGHHNDPRLPPGQQGSEARRGSRCARTWTATASSITTRIDRSAIPTTSARTCSGAAETSPGSRPWICGPRRKANYNYAANSCSGVCGHYTQIVWRTSVEVGCAMGTCPSQQYKNVVVCNYGPGGNSGGKPY